MVRDMRMEKRLFLIALAATVSCALASSSRAQTTNVIVNDTFNAGVRGYPTTPPYSDDGVVSIYGATESAWIRGGAGTITVQAPGGGAPTVGSPNVLAGS